MSTRDPLLTVTQVAEWLNVEPRFVYRLTGSGQLDKTYVGRYLRVYESSVIAYLDARTVKASPRPPRARRPGPRARRLRAVASA